jgi:hypothetical protein
MVKDILENGKLHVDTFQDVSLDILRDVLEQLIQK